MICTTPTWSPYVPQRIPYWGFCHRSGICALRYTCLYGKQLKIISGIPSSGYPHCLDTCTWGSSNLLVPSTVWHHHVFNSLLLTPNMYAIFQHSGLICDDRGSSHWCACSQAYHQCICAHLRAFPRIVEHFCGIHAYENGVQETTSAQSQS